jgi:cytochrome c556
MQRSTKSTVIVAGLALAAFVTSFSAKAEQRPPQAPAPQAPAAQAKPPAQPPAPPPAAGTPAKPLVPVAASSVANNPDQYVNEFVTMTATVEANLTKTAFSVDQDKTKSTGKEVLVLAPSLQKPADQNGYVTVIGQLIKFDEKEVASKLKDYQIDLSAADIAKYKGKPVVLATAVIDNAGIDIAKKPIPPMTADDLTLQKIMTKLPAAQAAVRKTLDSKDAAGAKEQATLLKDSFTQIETFFKTKGNEEAMKFAGEGKNHADAILVNLGLNNIEAAKTSITPLGATCGSCHGKYRERMDDGTFRYKSAR